MKNIIKGVSVSILVFIISFKIYTKVWVEIGSFFKADITMLYVSSQFTHNILFAFAFGIIPIISYIIFTYYHIKKRLLVVVLILLSTIVVSFFRLYYVFKISYPAHVAYPIEEIKFEKYLHFGWIIGVLLVLILFKKLRSSIKSILLWLLEKV